MILVMLFVSVAMFGQRFGVEIMYKKKLKEWASPDSEYYSKLNALGINADSLAYVKIDLSKYRTPRTSQTFEEGFNLSGYVCIMIPVFDNEKRVNGVIMRIYKPSFYRYKYESFIIVEEMVELVAVIEEYGGKKVMDINKEPKKQTVKSELMYMDNGEIIYRTSSRKPLRKMFF